MKDTTSNHTTKNPFRAGSLSSAALITLTAFAVAGTAQAATKTWNGSNTGNPAWYANTNWTPGVAPVDGDDLVFTGTVLLSHLAYANWGGDNDAQINSITFDAAAGAFVIGDAGGGTYKMLGDITNDSTNLQTLNFPFQLNADVTANAAAGDITIGGVISEDGSARSLIKSGSNTLSLTGASTYTGTTDINAGKLQLGNGGTTGSLSTSSVIDIASGATFVINQSDTVTQGTDFSSAAITGAGTIAHHGTGTLILDANALSNGQTHIGDLAGSDSATRILEIRDNSSLGSGQITFYKGGTLDLGADALTVSNFIFNGNYSSGTKTIKLDSEGAGHTGTIAGNMIIQNQTAGSFRMDVGATDTLTMSGIIGNYAAGGAGITKIGDGTLILSDTNTYKGNTTVNAGTLKLSGGSAIADGAGKGSVVVNASGTLDLNGSNETINGLSGAGIVDNTAGGGSTLTVGNNNNTTTFDGTIQDTGGTLNLTKVGTGALTLTSANTHAGNTRITNGTVVFTNADAFGTGQIEMGYVANDQVLEFGASGMNLNNNLFQQNTNGADRTIRLDLAGTNTGEISGLTTVQLTDAGQLLYDVGTDDTLTNSGNINHGGAGGTGLTKVGDGTLVLSGTSNNYKGATTVNGGTLSLASGYSHSGTGAYTVGGVAGGGTLNIADGVDISGHAMTISLGGVISPGNSPGTAITGNQTWNDGGAYLWEINDMAGGEGVDSGWDWLDIQGTLDISATFDILITSLDLSNNSGLADGFDYTGLSYLDSYASFTIATATGGVTGFDASAFNLDDSSFLNPKVGWSISLDEINNDIVLNAFFVPEPSSTALLGLGGLALMLRRKRS